MSLLRRRVSLVATVPRKWARWSKSRGSNPGTARDLWISKSLRSAVKRTRTFIQWTRDFSLRVKRLGRESHCSFRLLLWLRIVMKYVILSHFKDRLFSRLFAGSFLKIFIAKKVGTTFSRTNKIIPLTNSNNIYMNQK
jgi:hypothetical protein